MNYAQTIYQRSLQLPDPAAQEALDFIDFLLQRYTVTAKAPPQVGSRQDTAAFLKAIADGWGDDFPDDIDDTDLGVDSPRDSL
jgi:hypothetical protein